MADKVRVVWGKMLIAPVQFNNFDLGPFEFTLPQGIVLIDAVSMTDTGLNLHVIGLTSHGPVIVQTSPDLATWTPVFTNSPVTGGWQYVDPDATSVPQRFYRVEEQ